MRLPEHFGHYVRVGLATWFACIAVYETVQNGFMATHVLIWWAAVVMWVTIVVIEAVRIRRGGNGNKEGTDAP